MADSRPFCAYTRSPLGWLKIEGAGRSLYSLGFVAKKPRGASSPVPEAVRRELEEYFKGSRKRFSLKMAPQGTAFQHKVWRALRRISHGRKISYAQVAARIGRPKSVRAVANAVGQNRLAILIPCHRVIGSDGSLTGYAYGLRKKAWLLSHEIGL